MATTPPDGINMATAPLTAGSISNADFRLLVDAVTDYAIFLMDATGHVLSWNKGAQKVKGYTQAEVVGKHFSMFYPQDLLDRQWPQHELKIATETGRFEDEGWRLRKDGTRFWANVIITRLSGPGGEHRGFSKITRDLSERRSQEELLRMSEERFRLLVEGVKDYAIFMLDQQGHVMSWNAGAQQNKGYTASEIIGKHFSVFYPPDLIASGWPANELKLALRNGQLEDEGWRLRKDGTRFWANVTITALHDEQGLHRGFAKVTRDMTERRRVSELEDEGRQMTTFLAMLGHELRNPLAPISNAVALLERDDTRSKTVELTRGIISRQVRQLNRLVDDLLDVSRITSGKINLESKPVRLREVIAEAVEASRPLIEGHAHRFDVDAGATDSWVLGDKARLVQVLCNLLNNAAKFTPNEGRLALRMTRQDGLVELSVSDNGPGIRTENLQNIFNLFVQGEQDVARSHGGLGLGLSLVQQLVRMHGGDVGAYSKGVAGEGSEFVIRLPAIAAPADVDDGQPQGRTDASGRGMVLVVDDNQDAADTMVMVLDSLGYRADAVYDGLAAVDKIKADRPQLVLLDIGLPGISGIEVAKRVRAEVLNPPALVALTGYGQASDREASLTVGFRAHMTKPVDIEELVTMLEDMLPAPKD
ncbi:MAG: PAS domain S-box protein [Pseudomonadota bacterium]